MCELLCGGSFSVGAEVLFKGVAAVFCECGGVEFFGESVEASAEFFGGHALRAEVNVEEGAFFPVGRFDESIGLFEPVVEDGTGERGEDGDLYFIEFEISNKGVDVVKD